MTQRFDEFLNDSTFPGDVLQEAARTLLAERTDYIPINQMRANLSNAVVDARAIEAAIQWFEANPSAMENAALALLADAWEDDPETVRSALDEASTAMPILETGIAAITAMYIAWLLATRGKSSEELREKETVMVNGERHIERVSKTTFWGPSGPLRAIVELFRPGSSPNS